MDEDKDDDEYMKLQESPEVTNLPLHKAIKEGNINRVADLLKQSFPEDEDPSLKMFSHLPFNHHMKIAEPLVRSFRFQKQEKEKEYIVVNLNRIRGVLHGCVLLGRTDVIKYLLMLNIPDENLIFKQDHLYFTPLFFARNKHVAELIVENIQPIDRQQAFLSITNANKQTALHYIAEHGKTEVVEYLVQKSLKNTDIILRIDVWKKTALHDAKNRDIAHLLIQSIQSERRTCYIMAEDKDEYTALHISALFGRTDVVEYLCLLPEAGEELLLKTSLDGRTALHCSVNSSVAAIILDSVSDPLSYVSAVDNYSQTAVMTAAKEGNYDTMPYLLEYFDTVYENPRISLKQILEKKNSANQTIFHLAAISPYINELYEILEDYVDYIDVRQVISPDVCNNSPLSYVAGRFSTELFAKLIMRLPLPLRQMFINSQNIHGANCRTIIQQPYFYEHFYLHRVLCEPVASSKDGKHGKKFSGYGKTIGFHTNEIISPHMHFAPDKNLYKVMKYALNEYSLIAPCFLSSHSLSEGTLSRGQSQEIMLRQTGASCSSTEDRSQPQNKENSPTLWLNIDCNKLDMTGSASGAEVQGAINDTDTAALHGKPKIIIIKEIVTSERKATQPTPPGPDYMIVTVTYDDSTSYNKSKSQVHDDIDSVVDELRNQVGVQSVRVNSTLGRRYHTSDMNVKDINGNFLSPEALFEMPTRRGKALIICNSHNRDGWQQELSDAERLLGTQLGLEYSVKLNLSVAEMTEAISKFAHTPEHGAVVALAIMSHGNLNGDICGNDSGTVCSVQSVVDSLCPPELKNTPKIILLSFCRGGLGQPRSNRTKYAWECEVLGDIIQTMSYNPIRWELRRDDKEKEWLMHPFHPVNVPVNCYVCFSTLPDSKARRGWMLENFSSHLAALADTAGLLTKHSHIVDPSGRTTGDEVADVEPKDRLTSRLPASNDRSRNSTPSTRVELITLFTDVSGIVREKSEFTQYMNHCYALDKESEPVYLEVFLVGI